MKARLLCKGAFLIIGILFMDFPYSFAHERASRALPVSVQNKNLKGQVTDQQGNPLPGVTVAVEGTTNGTTTNSNGNFTLQNVPGNAILIVSSIGYETQKVTVNSEDIINIKLVSSQTALNQVVVVGYGTQKKADLTGSIAPVNVKQLNMAPVPNILQGMEGRMAGVQVINTSGARPGPDLTIRIRGEGSINSSDDPLYVIDGFPGVGDLNSINPSDIQSIDVLKDASATAIYGSRGSNGVIIITTKRGIPGQTTVNLNVSYGIQTVEKEYNLLDAAQFAEYTNTVAKADGLSPVFSNPSIFGTGTNWQNEIFKPAPIQKIALNILGGNSKSRYAISYGNYVQNGLEIGSGYIRNDFRINLDNDLSDKVSTGVNLYVARIKDNEDNPAAASAALTISPILPVKDSSGKWMSNQDLASKYGFGFYDKGNPVAMAQDITNNLFQTHILGNAFLQYTVLNGLTFKTSFGIDDENGKFTYFVPDGVPNAGIVESGGLAQISYSDYFSWLNENTLTFTRAWRNQTLNLLGGVSFQQMNSGNATAEAEDFTDNFYSFNNLGLGSVQQPSESSANGWFMDSYYLRANYKLRSKYFATFTIRSDGSSVFGSNKKYGVFPSGALAWVVSEEPFMTSLHKINFLKLRISYGLTGNNNIGTYQSLAQMGGSQYILGGSRVVGTVPISIANPDLSWEKMAEFDAGIDAEIFNNRLSFTADYYNKTTSALLLNVPIPLSSGFSSSLQNIGKVSNNGIELSVNSINIRNKNFTWTSSFNISSNRNKVLSLGKGTDQIISNGQFWYFNEYSITKVGEPIGMFYMYKSAGIWQLGQDIAHSAQPNAKPGDPKFVDINHDGVINSADRTIVGSPYPKFIAGLTNNIKFKNFDLEVDLNEVYGNKILNNGYIDIMFPNATTNITKEYYKNLWTPENPTNTHLRAGSNIDPTASSMYLENGSYLRLQNVVFSYSLPKPFLDKVKIKELKFFLSVQNLFTLTKYSGYNPEANVFGDSNLTLGYDYDYYPVARTYNAGFNLTF